MRQQLLQTYLHQISQLSDQGIDQLVRIAQIKKLRKGEVLLEKGQICTGYYLAEAGFLCAHYEDGGKKVRTNFIFEGSFISDLSSLREQTPSAMHIETGEDGCFWLFDSKLLFECGMGSAEIMNFSHQLVSRLKLEAAEYENMVKLNKPAERYTYISDNNPEILQRISFSQLASYLGITKDTLGRIRKKDPL